MTDREIQVARESMETYIGFANALKNNPKSHMFYIAAATALNDFFVRVGSDDYICDLASRIPCERLLCADCKHAKKFRRESVSEADGLENETAFCTVCLCEGSPFFNQENVNPYSCNDYVYNYTK